MLHLKWQFKCWGLALQAIRSPAGARSFILERNDLAKSLCELDDKHRRNLGIAQDELITRCEGWSSARATTMDR